MAAEWPIKLVDTYEEIGRGVVEPGEEVLATWAKIQQKDGSVDPKAAIWIICPRCGTLGHCPRTGSRYDTGPSWEITEGENGLTMCPSILCNSTIRADGQKLGRECGGHYFLTDGVLRET